MKCKECNKPLKGKFAKKFCSRSCSVTHSNKLRKKKHGNCVQCNKELTFKQSKFCSYECSAEHRIKTHIDRWLYDPDSIKVLPKGIKKHILKNGECEVCHRKEWMGEKIPIEVDHIDGNSENNRPENLRAICPNCHAQTETYKGANRGNGRHARRERYSRGLSY